ncbi:MAG: hypothetical protein Q4A36_00220 [Candidatus Saccharibacteria bacterium]|nr:hypothetical protein [Candidatus Saccharibacteria bacterium]
MLLGVLNKVFLRRRRQFRLPGKNLRRAGFCSSVLLAALIIFGVCPIASGSDDTVDAAAKSSNTSLTMTTNYESARLDIVPTDLAGTFATSPNDKVARFGIITDNATGYKLTIKEKTTTNSGKLVNSDGSFYLLFLLLPQQQTLAMVNGGINPVNTSLVHLPGSL